MMRGSNNPAGVYNGSHVTVGRPSVPGKPSSTMNHHMPTQPVGNGFYNGSVQYHHPEIRHHAAAAPTTTSNPVPPQQVAFSNGFHYAYPANATSTHPPVAPNPHQVGLPTVGFMTAPPSW